VGRAQGEAAVLGSNGTENSLRPNCDH
jgi:hypothetical protein